MAMRLISPKLNESLGKAVLLEYHPGAAAMVGTDMVAKAAPAMTDLIGGHIQFMIVASGTVLPHVRSGKLVALAVTATKRISQLPNVPTIAEFYREFEAQSWVGILAPARAPNEIVDRLNAEFGKALADPQVRGRFEDLGVEVAGSTADAFAKWIAEQSDKWGRVSRERRIALD